jgi:ABC-type arginine/histidine transport system permease subunit
MASVTEDVGARAGGGEEATSLVSIITVMDITGVARVIASRNFAFYEAFVTAAAFYLAIVYLFILLAKRIEGRLHAHLAAADSSTSQKVRP